MNESTSARTDEYWAALAVDELTPELNERIDSFYRWVESSGRRYIWARAYEVYNQALLNGPDINYGGNQGEYHLITINQTRNIIKHLINLTINTRPTFEPRASNTDSRSQKQTKLARSLLDYYLRDKRLERHIRSALEFASLYGEGFVTVNWEPEDGEVVGRDPDTGIEVKQGDISYLAYEPMDVVRDPALTSFNQNTWTCVKTFRNKWDLVARFPEHRDAILSESSTRDVTRNFKLFTDPVLQQTDLIETWEFFHARTASMPEGRYTMFLYGGGALLDSPLPYAKVPVYRLAADDIGGSSFGYGTIFDLLPMQEAIDNLYSTITTNQQTFGTQLIAIPKGSDITPTQLTEGLTAVEYNPGPGGGAPTPLQLTSTAPEIFNHLSRMEKTMEMIGGINSVIRGEPPAAGMSGAAMALLQSQAVQFAQGLQSNYVQLLEDVGTATIQTLRDYAVTDRVVAIVGKANRSNLQSFTGEDLKSINRVQVDVGNPVSRTTAGKLQIAETLIQNKLISNAQEYLAVLETGNLETLTEGPMNELLSIRAENEALSEGNDVPVLITDRHDTHILEHKAVLSDPAVREDPELMQAAMKHIQTHWQLWSDPMNAGLLQALGIPPAPAGAAPGGAAPPAGATQGGAPVGVEGDANGMAEQMQPNMPNLPAGAVPVNGAAVQ